jgi:peptide deformylase
MALIEVLRFPHQILRQQCEPVAAITDDVLKLIDDMVETMYSYKGVGLAAPQVGVAQNIIVLDVGQGLVSLINPEISLSEGAVAKEEGCLCLPDLSVTVERRERIQIKGIDRKGNPVILEADGLLARALQHEIDHLHGTLIIDKLSKLKRDLIIKRLRKQQLKAQK